jgi:signal transduction histidine kinase
VRHSGCSGEEDLIVSVLTDGGLRIAVTDPGASEEQAEIKERDFGFGGLGLRIVDELVEAWGTERQPEGNVVWAELPAAPANDSARPRAASRSEEAQSPLNHGED